MVMTVESIFVHNDRLWEIVEVGDSWFACDDQGNETGPFATSEEAEDWVLEIEE